MKQCATVLLYLSLFGAFVASGADKKTRDQQVIEDRDEMKKDDSWIYNDLDRAKKIAHQSGRPLFVVFRCIP